jgi:hypothetical protein
MKSRVHWFLFLVLSGALHAALPELRVADDRRHLETIEGKPFFLLGDTAWELFHRLNKQETIAYLDNRAAKGFNTILAVALAEYEFEQPNAEGELPLEANDPTRPRDAYFRHVDWVVDQAARRGLHTGLLPTWGDKWNKLWGRGPEIFTPENAAVYGEWLGRRYKNQPVIWILGGDRSVDNDRHRAILRAMAAGLEKGDGGKHLITYHPKGGTNSSDSWADEDWLDFHLFQSGHGKLAGHNFDYNAKNLSLPALKPTLDGEPNYEDHPVRGLMQDGKPTVWFDDYDARRAAWWSVLSGACGHVYGTHSIWQFHDPLKRKAVTDARTPWQDAMELPGAAQMGVMRNFLHEIPWWTLRRNEGFLTGKPKQGWKPGQVPMAAVSSDWSVAVVYLPDAGIGGLGLDFNAMACSNNDVDAWILDPVSGERKPLPPLESGALDAVFKDLPASPPRPIDRVLLIRKKKDKPAG